jgi:thiamine biosynthesis lipoprotein
MKLVPLLLCFAAPAVAVAQVDVRRDVLSMGTSLTVEVTAMDRAKALAASEQALAAVAAVEARLSAWRPGSDVSRVRAGAVLQPIPVEPATAADLRWAFDVSVLTGGAFDPTVGSLVEAHGLRSGGRWPSPAELDHARFNTGRHWFTIEASKVVRWAPGAALDADGFGKGLALDAALAAVQRAGVSAATFDFGGQVLEFGGAGRWLPIAHPTRRDELVAEVWLPPGVSAATSGNGERHERPDGRALGHLLDPRSGLPAADFGSVTALAASAGLADAASTALFVLGPAAPELRTVCRALPAEAVFVEFVAPGPGAPSAVRVRATAGLRHAVRTRGGDAEFFPDLPTK